MEQDFELIKTVSAKYNRGASKLLQYGTSGFREKAEELVHVMYRMGLLAVLRSKYRKGSTVGIMVTASHNPECDNGVKLCDPDGKMIDLEWEGFATELVNAEDSAVVECLKKIVRSSEIDYNTHANIFIARDTRSSSASLSSAAEAGVKTLKGEITDFGLMTTPQLHFVVYCQNYSSYGTPTIDGYYSKLSGAFSALRKDVPKEKYIPEVYVDGANGIGALKIKELQERIDSLKFSIFNDGSDGVLNFNCGADYVKIKQSAPDNCDIQTGRRYASLDGDADRLVYFYQDSTGRFRLLDGDKIAALVAQYLQNLIRATKIYPPLEVRVVQTAYANSSSTKYIEKELGIRVVCVPTGVKHLHHAASLCDVGVYFEANGHGTVVFSDNAKTKLSGKQEAAKKLLTTIDLINETVGDAISDLLLTEAILHELDWDLETWDALYTDLPNLQVKVKVPDRTAITTTDAERKCVTPHGLQEAIDCCVSKYADARSFVRPSGTEDVVRVYAEASSQAEVKQLAEEVALLVEKFTS